MIDRGFVFAIAHVRGGQINGRQWYEDGKLLKKKNTFFDFIDCAEELLKKGYSKKQGLYAVGGSAGGLLMGAVINLAPELFNGVVASVPFVDVVTTMLDESIPLTTAEFGQLMQQRCQSFRQHDVTVPPPFSLVDADRASLEVDFIPAQSDDFTNPHAGGIHQAEQQLVT